jgi:hypothetical protein
MGRIIYGVDLSKNITPVIVRDAIIECFRQANREVLDEMDEYTEWESEKERKRFRDIQIDLIIKTAFKEAGEDFSHPTKEGIIKVMGKLADFASKFRKPEIVRRHYNEIKSILDKC